MNPQDLSVFEISINLTSGHRAANIAAGKVPGDEMTFPPLYETHPNPTPAVIAEVLNKLAAAITNGDNSIRQNISNGHWIEQGP